VGLHCVLLLSRELKRDEKEENGSVRCNQRRGHWNVVDSTPVLAGGSENKQTKPRKSYPDNQTEQDGKRGMDVLCACLLWPSLSLSFPPVLCCCSASGVPDLRCPAWWCHCRDLAACKESLANCCLSLKAHQQPVLQLASIDSPTIKIK